MHAGNEIFLCAKPGTRNAGTLEPWNPGTLEPWNAGTLEPNSPPGKAQSFHTTPHTSPGCP
jgi:hypothetical protein